MIQRVPESISPKHKFAAGRKNARRFVRRALVLEMLQVWVQRYLIDAAAALRIGVRDVLPCMMRWMRT
jgi:hypothetical protein